MTYKLFTDGGARNNPGPAAVGCVLYKNDEVLETYKKYIGEKTNNEAEYFALIAGLSLAKKHKVQKIDCYLDSELVIKQLNKEYKVKNARLKDLYEQVTKISEFFEKITFKHVKRDQNTVADGLVNSALDAYLS